MHRSADKPSLLIVVNVDWFFLSHRLPIALEAKRRGFEVHIAVAVTDRLAEMQSYGLQVHELKLRRGVGNPWGEIKSFVSIFKLLRKLRPDIVHLVTIKPVLYGGIAARLARTKAVVAAISGLGTVFSSRGFWAHFRRRIVSALYSAALRHERMTVIVQNSSDFAELSKICSLRDEMFVTISGSGADLRKFRPTPLPTNGLPCIVMASRLLSDKGVWEFVDAADILKQSGIAARFCLVGSIDPSNLTSLSRADVARISRGDTVEVWGHRLDMEVVLSEAFAVVLPSYYGEGVPKILIEAAAAGRPIVTTDTPGCRDVVDIDHSGIIVPPRSSDALAVAIKKLLQNPDLAAAMGRRGRQIAIERFDVQSVVDQHMRIYEVLLNSDKRTCQNADV